MACLVPGVGVQVSGTLAFLQAAGCKRSPRRLKEKPRQERRRHGALPAAGTLALTSSMPTSAHFIRALAFVSYS